MKHKNLCLNTMKKNKSYVKISPKNLYNFFSTIHDIVNTIPFFSIL